jgi:hypothetical protein
MSIWAFAARSCELLGYGTICVLSFREALRTLTWSAKQTQRRLLEASETLIFLGSFLVVVDVLYAFNIMSNNLRPSVIFDQMVFALLNSMGNALMALGAAVLPALWIEVGLATASMQRLRSRLVIALYVLAAALCTFFVFIVVLCVYVFFAPVRANMLMGQLFIVGLAIILVCFRMGVWLLGKPQSKQFPTSSRFQLRGVSEGSSMAEKMLRLAWIAANRVTAFSALAMVGIGMWMVGNTVQSVPLNYLGGSVCCKLGGICGSAWCVLDYSRKTQERRNSVDPERSVDQRSRSDHPSLDLQADKLAQALSRGSHHDSFATRVQNATDRTSGASVTV